MPAELQEQVITPVKQAKSRSQMPITVSLKNLGVKRSSYFHWQRTERWQQEQSEPTPPVQAFEALPEEKQAVVDYALEHPEIRHRELS